MRFGRSALILALGVLAPACGGIAVFDDGAGGEGGATSASGSSKATGSGASKATTSATSASVATVATTIAGGARTLVEDQSIEVGQQFEVKIDADPRMLGSTLVARAPSDFAELTWTRSTAPSGSIVFNGALPSNTWEWRNFGTSVVATPQVDHPESFPFAQGPWIFSLASSITNAHVSVWGRRTVDGGFHGGVLDVVFYVPADLVSDAYLTEMATSAYESWAGITLGTVSFVPIDEQFVVLDDFNLGAAIEQTKAQPTRPALSVILTSEIIGENEGAAGFSLGIPGTGLDPGSSQGAIVWQLTDPFFDTVILRHEAGHFAGLFHTSEFIPPLQDPLDDTPACATIETDPFACPDTTFVMFPAGPLSGTGTFSPKETAVIQGGALYRGVFSPGEQPEPPLPLASGGGAPFRIASPEDRRRAGERLAAAPIAVPSFDVAALDLEPSVRATLFGLGCGTGAPPGDDLAVAASVDVDTLLRVAEDRLVPTLARRRALSALGRLGSRGDAALATRLDRLARDGSLPRLVRTGAFRALGAVDETRHAAVKQSFANGGDVALRVSATR